MQMYTFAERWSRRSPAWCPAFRRTVACSLGCAALLTVCLALAAAPEPATAGKSATAGEPFAARGARDGDVPAWTVQAVAPSGWTADCCTYAKAIGVNFVLYRGEWSGNPQQVMVLNVWPRKLPTLTAEIEADRKHYLQADPAAKVSPITIRHPAMPCQATLFQGTDHVDDIVVFCEPAKASGIRWSWSMTLDDGDPTRNALLAAFMRVVMASRYVRDVTPGS